MRVKRLLPWALILWGVTAAFVTLGTVMAQTEILPGADAVARAADIARQKDVVWLSLCVCIVCIIFSAWLVRQMLQQQGEAVKALNGLRDELARRPCVYLKPQVPPHE